MTDAEELQHFRAQKVVFQKRARTTALTFGILAITALVALVYAFFQQTAAKKQTALYEVKVDSLQREIKGMETAQALATSRANAVQVALDECEKKSKLK